MPALKLFPDFTPLWPASTRTCSRTVSNRIFNLSPRFPGQLRRLAAGTKVYATNRAHIASIEMRLPGVEEQTAIAAVLSDMDAELAALEARLDKTRDLKQAMMQELLIGKTRLIQPEVAHV